ncbi:hypothetical protein D9756_009797 [Leucocoprinus leucothites]|uniref:Nephrocystin 3-like N-terminal domain-containing protein n=1 Tax=Leucocoprinus leucothites TaxID=201217 RepID=A0A8H5CXK0_9AGAR|nr:hypothetical protein D9756_009797 [Leucoagaricus leucothites]
MRHVYYHCPLTNVYSSSRFTLGAQALLPDSLGQGGTHTLQPESTSLLTTMSFFSNSHGFQVTNSSLTSIDQRTLTVNIHNVHNTTQSTHVNRTGNINTVSNKPGLRELLAHSIPGATHDSSERYPPPLCYPGTRQNFINILTEWGRNTSRDHPERLAWMKGPAGVGKSAIAQSTAQALGNTLGASFFFSRPNHRDDPNRFFTSIAYQLAVKQQAFGDFLDQKIQHDPTIITKSLQFHFDELLVAPVRALKQQGKELPEMAIFVDGLDECNDEGAQQEIVLLVAKSLRDEDTPFRWIFFSRLEPPLVSTFDRPEIKPFIAQFELTVTRELDPEIYHFLASRLKEIRERYDLDESWPTGENLRTLVEISSGLYACAQAIALYVEDHEGAATPKQQLDVVLGLASRIKVKGGSKHPLSSLDLFYTLILERLHQQRLADIQLILLATRLSSFEGRRFTEVEACANLLGHSREDFCIICRSLHAVMKISNFHHITFYHASFINFLEDPARSGEYCIWLAIPRLLRHIMQSMGSIRLDTNSDLVPYLSWRDSVSRQHLRTQYRNTCDAFFELLGLMILREIQDDETYRLVKEFDLRRLLLVEGVDLPGWDCNIDKLLSRLEIVQLGGYIRPLRLKNTFLSVFRKDKHSAPRHFVIGSGKRRKILRIIAKGWGKIAHIDAYSKGAMEELRKELAC